MKMQTRLLMVVLVLTLSGCGWLLQREDLNFESRFVRKIHLPEYLVGTLNFDLVGRNSFGGFLCMGIIQGSESDISEVVAQIKTLEPKVMHYDDYPELLEYVKSLYRQINHTMPQSFVWKNITEFEVQGQQESIRFYLSNSGTQIFVIWIGEKI